MSADGPATAARVLAVLDLTSLGEDDTSETIAGLCEAAASGGHPAAVCVYPEHIETARSELDARSAADVAIATVVNFPDGSNDLARALRETRRALAGADFIKTSTGKSARGATIESARVILECLRERDGRGGFKAAGGIQNIAEAGRYLALADEILGPDWVTSANFRIGANSLLKKLRSVLNQQDK